VEDGGPVVAAPHYGKAREHAHVAIVDADAIRMAVPRHAARSS